MYAKNLKHLINLSNLVQKLKISAWLRCDLPKIADPLPPPLPWPPPMVRCSGDQYRGVSQGSYGWVWGAGIQQTGHGPIPYWLFYWDILGVRRWGSQQDQDLDHHLPSLCPSPGHLHPYRQLQRPWGECAGLLSNINMMYYVLLLATEVNSCMKLYTK